MIIYIKIDENSFYIFCFTFLDLESYYFRINKRIKYSTTNYLTFSIIYIQIDINILYLLKKLAQIIFICSNYSKIKIYLKRSIFYMI